MNIDLIVTGKTNVDYVLKGFAEYEKRLGKYLRFRTVVLPDVKNGSALSKAELMQREAETLLPRLSNYDRIVLLDEGGEEYSSEEFAGWIGEQANRSIRSIAFVIGGAYGFAECVYRVVKMKMSLSRMTFSHQMIRLLFIEQLYRAMTILGGEPYHHR